MQNGINLRGINRALETWGPKLSNCETMSIKIEQLKLKRPKIKQL
jgi:hypothetical protein